jgi:hypothetical protein
MACSAPWVVRQISSPTKYTLSSNPYFSNTYGTEA